MKNAIILHGRPNKESYYDASRKSQSNSHWIPWLQQNLIVKDVLAQAPELPKPYEPKYEDWKQIFEREPVSEDTILIGHSYGAGFLVRWLTENADKKVGKVVFVAPSLGYGFDDRKQFFGFDIDSGIASRTHGITIIVAKDDKDAVQQATNELMSAVEGIKLRKLETGGHFTFGSMATEEFPELLEEVFL